MLELVVDDGFAQKRRGCDGAVISIAGFEPKASGGSARKFELRPLKLSQGSVEPEGVDGLSYEVQRMSVYY